MAVTSNGDFAAKESDDTHQGQARWKIIAALLCMTFFRRECSLLCSTPRKLIRRVLRQTHYPPQELLHQISPHEDTRGARSSIL